MCHAGHCLIPSYSLQLHGDWNAISRVLRRLALCFAWGAVSSPQRLLVATATAPTTLPQVIVEDGVAFVNAAVASATGEDGLSANTARLDSTSPPCTKPTSTPELSGTPAGSSPAAADPPKPAAACLATETVLPPRPPDANDSSHQTGWGEAFGPPYSAIFLDVDSKDTSVGMSCPPAAFLEPAFLTTLKTLLHGGGGGGGQGGAGGPGVLAINVAARSKELFGRALDAVCAAFAGGEVSAIRRR